MIVGIPPNTCSICYLNFSNERTPLILTLCGHTYCKECLDILVIEKEIICPECKQITIISESPIKSLPKNRSLIDMIIYSEVKNNKTNKNTIDTYNSDDYNSNTSYTSENENKIINKKFNKMRLLNEFKSAIKIFETTYNNIFIEHPYINDIKEEFIIKEIDDVLNHIIFIVNNYRKELHSKVKKEFKKIKLIKNFKYSLNLYKQKILDLNKKIKYIYNNNNNQTTVKQEDLISNVNKTPQNNKTKNLLNDENITENKNKYNSFNNIKFNSDEIKDIHSNIKNIKSEFNLDKQNQSVEFINKNNNYEKLKQFEYIKLTKEEVQQIKADIQFINLFDISLKNYTTKIYNPCYYFFINKFQSEQIYEDIKKMLTKICDFDEYVCKYNIEEINSFNQKKFLKVFIETCINSDYKKIKYIFNHFKLNSNFICSDSLEKLVNQASLFEHSNYSSIFNLAGSGNSQTNQVNASSSNNEYEVPNNRNPINSNSLFNNYSNFSRTNNNNSTMFSNNSRLFNNSNRILPVNSCNISSNFKDKIFCLNTYLSYFKDKTDLNELIKFLIEEQNYIPFKLDIENKLDVKLSKDYEWIMNLHIF